jgi:hypothetical protein
VQSALSLIRRATLPSFHVHAIACLGDRAHSLNREAAGTVSAAMIEMARSA